MKRRLLLVFLLVVVLIAETIALFSFAEREQVPVFLQVGDYLGFNVDTDAIWLGTVPPGQEVSREVVVLGESGRIVVAHVSSPSFVRVMPPTAVMPSEGRLQFRVVALIPSDQPRGNYSGTLEIVTYASFLRNLL